MTALLKVGEGAEMPKYCLWVEDEDSWDYPKIANNPSVSDHKPIDTGLLDKNDNKIMRYPNPIGFGKDEEW